MQNVRGQNDAAGKGWGGRERRLRRPNVRAQAREAARALCEFIATAVATGDLKPGDRLPTERELMKRFGAGRNTIRKIMLGLQGEGKIVRQIGRGTFLSGPAPGAAGECPPKEMPLATIGRLASPADVMELRMIFEPQMVEVAVSRASQREIDTMEHCLQQAELAPTLAIFEHWDDVLHRTIAEASRNSLFVNVYEMISAVRNQAEWGELKERVLTADQRRLHMSEHVRIVDAIRRRDARAARTEMEEHLRHVQACMFGRS